MILLLKKKKKYLQEYVKESQDNPDHFNYIKYYQGDARDLKEMSVTTFTPRSSVATKPVNSTEDR